MARVQGLIALARGDRELAERRLRRGGRRLAAAASRTLPVGDGMTAVLADLGRPVVGLVEPERELERVRADRARTRSNHAPTGEPNAVVP